MALAGRQRDCCANSLVNQLIWYTTKWIRSELSNLPKEDTFGGNSPHPTTKSSRKRILAIHFCRGGNIGHGKTGFLVGLRGHELGLLVGALHRTTVVICGTS